MNTLAKLALACSLFALPLVTGCAAETNDEEIASSDQRIEGFPDCTQVSNGEWKLYVTSPKCGFDVKSGESFDIEIRLDKLKQGLKAPTPTNVYLYGPDDGNAPRLLAPSSTDPVRGNVYKTRLSVIRGSGPKNNGFYLRVGADFSWGKGDVEKDAKETLVVDTKVDFKK